jgi:hypothetical protein
VVKLTISVASQILSVTHALIREHKIHLNLASHSFIHSCIVESNHCCIDELVQLLALGVDKQITWLIGW